MQEEARCVGDASPSPILERNAACLTNAKWLLDEMERLWFHDNVIDFQGLGSWIGAMLVDACAPPFPSSPSLPKIAIAAATPPPPLLAQLESVDMASFRPLREAGKVLSTGDLPRAKLKRAQDAPGGVRLCFDEDESSTYSPTAASDLGDYTFEFKVRKLEPIPSESALLPQTPDCQATATETWYLSSSTAAAAGAVAAGAVAAGAVAAGAGSTPTPTIIPSATGTGKGTEVSKARRRRRRERRKHTRSLSELEFDEVRGFRDLGFKLTEDNLTPRVVSLLPGLEHYRTASPVRAGDTITHTRSSNGQQQQGQLEQEQEHEYRCQQQVNQQQRQDQQNERQARHAGSSSSSKGHMERIYPSHAWNIRRPDSPLLNLRMPDPHRTEGVDMKAHLRFWARAVASTVRQEC